MDFTKAIEVAHNIYWVGSYIKNDKFQCHAYLIKNANESILLDPGSMLTFEALITKVRSVIDLNDIKYIVIHHQDPDLAASVPIIEKLIHRDDLQIVTHSRISVLVKHYMIQSEFYEIDYNDFKLSTNNGLCLEFITTPYCHSLGAFVSYEPNSKSLFSSDIFGGLEEAWRFYAAEDYFQYAKEFHASYMPGKDIFNYSLRKIEQYDIELILPQHGSIIQKKYIAKLIDDMKNLECGLYIEEQYHNELLNVIKQLEESQNALSQQQQFLQDVVNGASAPMTAINCDYSIALMNDAVHRSIDTGSIADIENPKCYEVLHQLSTPCDGKDHPCPLKTVLDLKSEVQVMHNHPLADGTPCYVELSAKPLKDKMGDIYGIIESSHDVTGHLQTHDKLAKEKDLLDYKAKHDVLTGLPGRSFLLERMNQIIIKSIAQKNKVAILFIDLDNFKPINDTYGHQAGDIVLKFIAQRLKNAVRQTDTVARLGGDEFVVLLDSLELLDNITDVIAKLSRAINKKIDIEENEVRVTASIGVSICPDNGTNTKSLLNKADVAMYKAKEAGQNRCYFYA